MIIETKLTAQYYLSAQLLHFRPKPLLRYLCIALFVVLALLLINEAVIVVRGGVLPRGWWVLPAGLAYGALLFFIVLPWRVGRIFRSHPHMAEGTRVTLDDQGIGLHSTRGEIRLRWATLKKWKCNRDYVLVYHTNTLFHTFPRRCFADTAEFDAALELLNKRIGPPQP
jgi:YcxB-like protein